MILGSGAEKSKCSNLAENVVLGVICHADDEYGNYFVQFR